MPYKIRPRHSIRPPGALKTKRATLKGIWAKSTPDLEDPVSRIDISMPAKIRIQMPSSVAFNMPLLDLFVKDRFELFLLLLPLLRVIDTKTYP
jgi:hypothetical protein